MLFLDMGAQKTKQKIKNGGEVEVRGGCDLALRPRGGCKAFV